MLIKHVDFFFFKYIKQKNRNVYKTGPKIFHFLNELYILLLLVFIFIMHKIGTNKVSTMAK